MWRQSNLPGNPDSDQSISEEDEEHVNVSVGVNGMWTSENTKEEGGLLLQTKLEKLIGCGELNCAGETSNASMEATLREISSSLEDDVEVPDSPEERYIGSSRKAGSTFISAQENGPDDELRKISSTLEDDLEVPDSPEESDIASLRRAGSTFRSAQENGPDNEILHDDQVATWSSVSKETESLIHLNGIASVSTSYPSGFRAKKVVKDHVRPKFSFLSNTRGETSAKISDIAENVDPADDQAMEEDPIAESPSDFVERSEKEAVHGCTEDVVPKLLVPFVDKIQVMKRSSKPVNSLSTRFSYKESSSHIQDSDPDDELPGPMDSGSSTDDEPNYQSSVPNISNQKKQFVGDRFDEAIKASSLSKEGLLFDSPKLSSGFSMYGKLQQIMKQEKETELEILKKLQCRIEQADTSSYLDIKIMSRHLEGKLVVCKCSVMDLSADSLLLKNTQALTSKETVTTIIFNPKVCADVVDIEIGSFVRIYAPWKEMEVKKTNEVIILCSYFSNL